MGSCKRYEIQDVQSSAVIKRSNLSRYYIRRCDDNNRRKPDFKLTADTPYLALTGDIRDIYCQNFEENWPRYNGTALYLHTMPWCKISYMLVMESRLNINP